MSRFSLEAFFSILSAHAPQRVAWCIALSGGLDSAVLLHAMAELRALRPEWSVRAAHIDHQLQPQSAQWAEYCASLAQTLAVPCEVHRVQVTDIQAQGMEAAARRARYAAFAELLRADEVLLTAHHADDQLETLLIALMRGSGVPGLASMPVSAEFAAGRHVRPLLDFTRDDLQAWAVSRDIRYVDDPTNRDTRFDRNFLRHEIIPLLKARWPAAAHSVSRAARHLAEANELLEQLAEADLQCVARNGCLMASRMRELTPARRRLVWRHWIQRRGLLLPSTRGLTALDHDMLQAAADRNPCARWPGVEVHRHGDLLYAMVASSEWQPREVAWHWAAPLRLPGEMGLLQMNDAADVAAADATGAAIAVARLPEVLTLSFRGGGERIRLPNAEHHSAVKKLLQAARILPWRRSQLPLVYAGKTLVAIADLWVSHEFAAREGDERRRLVWSERPQLIPPTES